MSVKKVISLALLSRLTVWILSIIVANCAEPYDTSLSVVLHTPDNTKGDVLVSSLLGHFSSWDGTYFLGIALKGYQFEQFHAFFPLLPLSTRVLSAVLEPVLSSYLSPTSLILISGFILVNTSFVVSAVLLYLLTLQIFRNERISLISSQLYCWNPASIFMSALYTESYFAAFAFGGYYLLSKNQKLLASLSFALATFTRSNGTICAAFFLYSLLGDLYRFFHTKINSFEIVRSIGKTVLCCIITIAPLIIVLSYGFSLYCIEENTRPWCNNTLPNIYAFVQDYYWNVGAWRYYEVKQIPNFALASPMLILSFAGVAKYFGADFRRLFTLGMQRSESRTNTKNWFTDTDNIFVYIVHWGFLALFALTCMHVQVATRFLASQCPPIYWYTAYLITEESTKRQGLLVLWYFKIYFVVGTVLFSSFYPWT
eukprot:TRINITY_DN5176_c0_g1_i1.p1 TRINITY_DN5176_c0_g1~~TRINITY_DN5176_c0_g1_i1.p1  ORF type:complete len:427 (-),score=49.25 TRINITY_DN5176_c0_g1_i1:21-1301(-)